MDMSLSELREFVMDRGSLACCDSWGRKELDTTERLNWTETESKNLEKEMATHSSILAWKIPGMEEPGRLQSTGSQRAGHAWATSLSFFL